MLTSNESVEQALMRLDEDELSPVERKYLLTQLRQSFFDREGRIRDEESILDKFTKFQSRLPRFSGLSVICITLITQGIGAWWVYIYALTNLLVEQEYHMRWLKQVLTGNKGKNMYWLLSHFLTIWVWISLFQFNAHVLLTTKLATQKYTNKANAAVKRYWLEIQEFLNEATINLVNNYSVSDVVSDATRIVEDIGEKYKQKPNSGILGAFKDYVVDSVRSIQIVSSITNAVTKTTTKTLDTPIASSEYAEESKQLFLEEINSSIREGIHNGSLTKTLTTEVISKLIIGVTSSTPDLDENTLQTLLTEQEHVISIIKEFALHPKDSLQEMNSVLISQLTQLSRSSDTLNRAMPIQKIQRLEQRLQSTTNDTINRFEEVTTEIKSDFDIGLKSIIPFGENLSQLSKRFDLGCNELGYVPYTYNTLECGKTSFKPLQYLLPSNTLETSKQFGINPELAVDPMGNVLLTYLVAVNVSSMVSRVVTGVYNVTTRPLMKLVNKLKGQTPEQQYKTIEQFVKTHKIKY